MKENLPIVFALTGKASALRSHGSQLRRIYQFGCPVYKNGAFKLTELARLCGISRTTA